MAARPRFVLTGDALDGLLRRLDDDREQAAAKYETLRAGLIRFFEWRGGADPEAHADETIDRVARRLQEGEAVQNLVSYAAGVARFVHLEGLGIRKRDERLRRELRPAAPAVGEDARLECVRRCLRELPDDGAALVLAYYEHQGGRGKIDGRAALAARLGVSVPSLRMRLHRLRAKLELCTMRCLGSAGARDAERHAATPE
jgi:DNA-directed RNA polymerase specialized sigma24 family protein